MSTERRMVLAAGADRAKEFAELFARAPLDRWSVMPAETLSKARLLLQYNPGDVLLVHEDLLEAEGSQGLAWLCWRREYPVVFLGDEPENFSRAMDLGATTCVARDMAMAHPPLLDQVLSQALETFETRRALERAKTQLAQSKLHVDRLVTTLWRDSPRHQDQTWYSQRHLMERLQEELARSERHKVPLSLAVGELENSYSAELAGTISDWTCDTLLQGKRRCDVVGQYGPKGFLILMVHTPLEGGVVCCKRLQRVLEEETEPKRGPHAPLRAYFGLASTAGEAVSAQSLLRMAEENLENARSAMCERVAAG